MAESVAAKRTRARKILERLDRAYPDAAIALRFSNPLELLAATILSAQRARGLDTEGSLLKRVRGIVPLVGPVILGALAEVEERTMALEARGFTRPGHRTLLWQPADDSVQRLVRWLLLLVVPVLVLARGTGLLA